MADSFKIVASLDINKSAKLIKDDIPKLQEYIKNEKIEIVAGLNLSKSQSLIQAQLNTIANQAKAPTIHVGVDLGNSQSAVQGATNGLKTVQEQAKQTASAVQQVGQELSVNITDASINKINKAFHVSSKATDEYRNNIKALATELSTAWNTYDEDKYYQTLRKIINLIGQFQVKHKAISTSSFDYSSLMEQIAILEKSIGYRLKDSGRFVIDPKFRAELEYVTGSAEKLRSILNSVFGRKWTFNTNLSGTSLRNFLDTQSVGIAGLDTNYGKYAESQYGGANQARYFVETYEKLMELKAQAKATISDFDAMWDSIVSPEDEQFFIKNIENVIAEILKLNNYTQRNNDPFGWFEPIIDEANTASQSISTLTSNISALQNTANNPTSANSKNYFSNNVDVLKNIQNFKEEENAIKTLEQTFKNLGATVTSVERKTSNGFLTSFTTEVRTSTGEIEKFNYAWKNINAGTGSTTEDWRYVLTNIESSDKAVQRLIDSQKKYQSQVEATATSLKAQLNTIQSGYTDKNGAKYISNTSNQTALANQYKVVESAIEKLKTADQTTFASMKANAEAEITTLKNMVKEFQNAEYAATSLRTKDINTNKSIQTQELDKFISKISSCKPILDAMTGDISQLKVLLNNITDATSFTKYLNELDIAKAKFESLRALYQSIGGYNKQLDNLAKSWQKQGIYVGNVQTTVENLKQSLANVTTADGLTAWVNDFKNQIGAISELPIKIAEYRQQISATSQEWYSQGILVGEIQTKMTSLARGLPKIKTQAGFEKWVTQWTELNQQATLLKSNLDRQVESQNNIYAIQTKIAGLNPTKDTAEIERLNKKLAAEQQTLANIQSEATLYTDLLSKEQQEQYITEQTAASREKLTSALNASAVSYKNEITSAISTLQGLQNKSVFNTNASNSQVAQTKQDIRDLIAEYNTLMSVLEKDKSPATLETVRTKLGELGAKLSQTTTSAKQFETELRNDNGAEKLAQRVALLKARLESLAKANPKALKRFGDEINSLMATLNNNPDARTVDQVTKSVQLLGREINNADLAGKTFWQTFKEKFTKFTGWMSMTYAVSLFTRSIREAVTELKEIDTILTEISKTSDRTEASLRKLGETSFATASKYGQKASDYLLGVQEMSRAGFDENSSEQMAELSTLAQSAGDMTAELANEYLIATNAGYQFGGSAEKLNSILDSQNYITNRNALNMSELAEATKIVASQASQSGIGIDKMTAAVGTMIATTQQGGEVAARAFKGILMNLQQVKGTAEDIGDGGEDITTESLTKYEKACADLGVSLKEVKDGVLQLRDPMVILEELANAVSKEAEGSIKVANLINAVGGKYRGNQLAALLQNWDTYSKMLSEFNSQEAENSAFEEAMKTANSWEGKLNELSNSWTEFINGIVNSSTAKSVIDFLNSIIKGIDSIRDGIGTIPTILGSIATVNAFKNVGVFKVVDDNLTTIFKRVQNVNKGFDLTSNSITECVNKFNTFNQNRDFGDDWTRFLNKISAQNINVANQFEELSKQGASARASVEGVYSAILNGNTRGFGNVKSLISLYNEIGKVNPQNQTAFASAVSQTNVQLGTYLMSIRDGTASMKGYAQQLVSTTAKTLALRVASIALNTVLMSAIPVAIGYIINKHKEEQQAIKDTGEEAEAQTNKIQSLYQSYTDIKTAVDNGTESKESLTSATNDLLEALGYEGNAVDDLIKKYGSLENAIDNVVISKLQEAHADLVASVAVYEDELLKIGDNWSASKWGNANTFSFLGNDKEYQKIKDVLNRAEGLTSSVSYGHNGRSNRYSYSLSGDNSTIEGIKQNYETLLALQEDFINEFGAEEAGKLDIYKDINSRLNEIKTAYENYTSEVEALNQNAAKTQVLQSLIGKELPQTIDEYKAYRQELIKSAQSSGAFIGSQEDIANSIDNTLSQMSEFEKFQNRLNNLKTAKSLFVEGRFNSKPINDYIESLSDEELEILVGLDTDIFDQGIDYVQKTIDEMNGISIHGSFKISDYQEQIESVSGNIKTLQDALDKLDNNEFDFTNDIYDLANAFPEYSTEILNASGDTEKLREVLQGILDIQPNDLIKSLTKLKGSLASDEDIKAVDNLINILRNSASVAYSVTSLSDSLQDLNDKESILSTVWKEMNDDGHISVSTYKSLCEMGEDYANIVSIVDGKLTLNVEALKELTKKKYEDEIATLRLTRAEEWHNAIIAGKNGEDTSKYTAIIDNIDAEIEAKKKVLELYENYDYKSEGSSSSDDDTPDSVKNFESELAKRQHEINLGLRKEDASYYDWLLSAAHKAYDGLADYEEDLWKYEEQVYEWRKDHEQDLFDQRIENLDKEKEKALENNDFSTAKTSVNTQITETQKRIVELKTSGKQDVDDEIKQLEEDLDDLNDTLNDINSQEYDFNISIKEDSIEDLEKEFEKSGDTSIYDKQIGIYTGLIADTQDEINRLLDLGYSRESDEIQELVDQIEGYSEDIADIWEKQTDVIKDNVDEQIEALDRNIENTGDTKLYSEKIKVYKDGQQQILDMIKFYRKQGYAEDSAIIKKLKKQWNDYQDSISDALQEQANAQVEAYNELLDEQKELLEQQKEAQDEYYDSEIKALEDKKEALEKVNEVIEEQNELEEKRQSLAEAERNLYKNVRLVYTNGQWVQKAREEDLQAVEDAEKDISDTLRKQEIEALENQITALEEAKSEFDEAIDKQITAIEESEKAFEKAMESSYKVRQQLDYEFISSIVGEDKAKEYQTNADNALKAIAESEQSDNNSSDNTNTQTDNSALIDSNNTVAETNREVADSNIQLAESNSKLGDIQGEGTERNIDTIDTQESTKTISPLEIDSETRVVFNNLLKKANAFLKNIPIEEFNKLLNNNLKSALDTAPKIADDVDKSKMVMNVVNNVTNAPVVNTTVNVDGRNKSDEELANIIATTTESKVTQALGAFVQGATNRFTKMMYGNT